ncbi:ricin-type beta-trefoil lectin domain protein [Actinocrinis sp.]|uniref:ricin-type beta-trefoil lectin domain protein n=1 Tax=Actinocrinis sp. TaxID=1920516 RepID=UPI002D2AF2C2|nr:ricin-type beta-trefoil lectin domain protein [Actinocrinis sp.]HZP50403.1 ricin-type beta-trefoil lectin domain protein [Actinocrinis sp.]
MGRQTRWLSAIVAVATALAACAAVLTLGTATANAESNGGVKVMPLGDSITHGYTVPGGYRIGLWQRFTANGYKVDFVGSQSNGPASLGDHDHEGHPGWRIDQIDADIVGWLGTYKPHTVLLHIGTNDISQNYNLSTAPNRLSALIDHITAAAPTAEVFVAQIIPLASSSLNAKVRTFNAAIPGIVQSKVSAGKHVHLVDMYDAVPTSDLADGVHPNATGYDKMAAVWYKALLAVPGSIGTSSQPSGSPSSSAGSGTGLVHAVGAGKCLDVPNGSQANSTQLDIAGCSGGSGQLFGYTSSRQVSVYGGAKCLDAYAKGTTAGTKVVIYDCNGGANQQWHLNANGTITSAQSGLCLSVTGGSTASGALVELWTCTGGSNQQWRLGG